MSDLRRRAINAYDAFTHDHRDRRRLLREMTAIAGSAMAAEVLIGTIAAAPVAAQQTDVADSRLVIRKGSYSIGAGNSLTGYFAAPASPPGRSAPLSSFMRIAA